MSVKKLFIPDEFGLEWITTEGELLYEQLKKTKLKDTDYACWRQHWLAGHLEPKYVREKLEEITKICKNSEDEELLKVLAHAARAFISAYALDSSTQPS